MKIHLQVLTFFIKPQICLFQVIVLLTTAKKWTKVKNTRAGRAKLWFLPTKYANLWRSRCRRRCRCHFLNSLMLLKGNSLTRRLGRMVHKIQHCWRKCHGFIFIAQNVPRILTSIVVAWQRAKRQPKNYSSGARFSKVPKLYGPFSGVIIPSVSQVRG